MYVTLYVTYIKLKFCTAHRSISSWGGNVSLIGHHPSSLESCLVCATYTTWTKQEGALITATGPDQLDTQVDEGFGDVDELEESSRVVATRTMDQDEHTITVAPPTDPECDEDEVITISYDYVMVHNVYPTYILFHSHSRMKLLRKWMTRQLTTGVSQGGRRWRGWLEHFEP